MQTLLKWLLRGVLALLLAALLALALAVQGAPQVAPHEAVTPADVDRAVVLARLNDPRRVPPGQLQRVALDERDIDLLLHHVAQRWLAARTRVSLLPGRATVQASFAAPLGRWLNVELGLRESAALPEVDLLRIGRLPVPPALALPLWRVIAPRLGAGADVERAAEMIEGVALTRGKMVVSYRLKPGAEGRLRQALLTPADEQRLRAYNERLAAATQRAQGNRVSLAQLLGPLFALAAERSAAAGGDAAQENRAVLLTLTAFANRLPLDPLVPAARTWPRPRPLVVTLQRRDDFPLHFLISALIAAVADTPLADAVGVWKELSDARPGGSGFSFNDIAADRAGTRFGETAVREAARLQSRVAAGAAEGDFMPDASDLPESLPEAEFAARYGGVGGAGYQRMMAEINRRVDALALSR